MNGTIHLGIQESGWLEVYSMYGILNGKYQLTEGNNRLNFNSVMRNGMYIYKVWINGELKQSDKLIKIE